MRGVESHTENMPPLVRFGLYFLNGVLSSSRQMLFFQIFDSPGACKAGVLGHKTYYSKDVEFHSLYILAICDNSRRVYPALAALKDPSVSFQRIWMVGDDKEVCIKY